MPGAATVGACFACNASAYCAGITASPTPVYPPGAWIPWEVASCDNFVCAAVRSDLSIVVWGTSPPAPPAGAYVLVSSGFDIMCALRAADQLPVCWGNNANGIITNAPAVPMSWLGVGRDCATALGAGDFKVYQWGYAGSASGCGSSPTGQFDMLCRGDGSGCARTLGGGAVVCFGVDNSHGQMNVPSGLNAVAVIALAASDQASCALLLGGLTTCWGSLTAGPSTPFIWIAGDGGCMCGILASTQAVACWCDSIAGTQTTGCRPERNHGPGGSVRGRGWRLCG